MSTNNNGGAAFPLKEALTCDNEGMSLRDYFAAHAPLPDLDMNLETHAEYRYRYADAMLKARNK